MKLFHKKYKRVTPWWRFFTAEFKMIAFHAEMTPIKGYSFEDEVVKLDSNGMLQIKPGFVFGASGPTVDHLPFGIFRKQLKSQRRGVCKHDGIYYISDHRVFAGDKSQEVKGLSDEMLKEDIIEDGGYDGRAETWEFFVGNFGNAAWESGVEK